MLFRSDSVRHKFPLQATYFRRVLPHVRGFPTLRVLRSIRLPISIRWAFPFHGDAPPTCTAFRFRHLGSGIALSPGFPLRASISTLQRPSHSQEPTGPPKFSNASLPTCHSLRTPTDIHILTLTDASNWLRGTLNPSPSAANLSRSCTSFQGTRLPLRPAGCSVYASTALFASTKTADSAAAATLDTGGWLALTRPGLSPG
jgi:hypothetical protein